MRNYAREHMQKHQAKQAVHSAVEFGEMRRTTAYEQMLMQLKRDQSLLKSIQAKTSKIAKKQALFEHYKPYIDGILEACPNVADDVVANMLVWTVDIASYDYALKIMQYMLHAKLGTPDQFDRTVATFVYEEISNTQLKLLNAEDENEPFDLDVLLKLEALLHTANQFPDHAFDMPDEVRAKLYVALGKAELKLIRDTPSEDLIHAQQAKNYLEIAIKLDDRCRGKIDLKTANKLIQDLTVQQPTIDAPAS